MSPFEVGGTIAAAGFIFGAGRIVEVIKNGRHVNIKVCEAIHAGLTKQLELIEQHVEQIREKVDTNYVAKRH